MTHLVAILGLSALCAVWVLLQRAADEPARGVTGECGACAERKACSDQCDGGPGNA